MNSYTSKFSMQIKCSSAEVAQIISKTLSPENEQIDNQTEIEMETKNEILIIVLKSTATISTIRNTVDDIINTINTIENVYKSVDEK